MNEIMELIYDAIKTINLAKVAIVNSVAFDVQVIENRVKRMNETVQKLENKILKEKDMQVAHDKRIRISRLEIDQIIRQHLLNTNIMGENDKISFEYQMNYLDSEAEFDGVDVQVTQEWYNI